MHFLRRQTALVIAFLGLLSATAYGAQKTDVVVLANGDRITGEIASLQLGQLKFKTDDAGTLYLEWDKLIRVIATTRVFDVSTTDGRRFLGSLEQTADRELRIMTATGNLVMVPMLDVTELAPIGASFWTKLDGSVSAGYNYTKSSGVGQLNFNSDTVYRRPAFSARLTASLTQTHTEESGTDNVSYIQGSYLRFRGGRWFVGGSGRFETNESLGIKLRSQAGGVYGPRLINSNRQQMGIAGGLAVNDERGVDVEPVVNLEGLVQFWWSYYRYDSPKSNLDVDFQYYPSLSSLGRQRVQFNGSFKHEVFKDFTTSLTLYDSYDSRPPNTAFDTNDIGVVISIGWSVLMANG